MFPKEREGAELASDNNVGGRRYTIRILADVIVRDNGRHSLSSHSACAGSCREVFKVVGVTFATGPVCEI
ncbi:MAG: hypothetical protein ACI8PB_002986 [Desulforhopalus sp.]|jgi:hypothetical protein